MHSKDKPYFPNLDGLRFFAFLIVFISHATLFIWQGPSFLAQGDLGVSFFFVLSGFLITYLLLSEKRLLHGKIKIINFYGRRILRIWPVYFITLIAGILIAKFNFNNIPFETGFDPASLPWYSGFIANYYLILFPVFSTVLAVLWSVSVEEQFYLCWPLVVRVIKEKYIPWFSVGLIIVAIVFRLRHFGNYKEVSYSTFSCMSDLAMGGLLGYMSFYLTGLKVKISNSLTKWKVSTLYILLIISLGIKMFSYLIIPEFLRPLYVSISPVIFSIIFACIIFEQNYSTHSLFKIGNSRMFTYLGKISYGLYAYHMIAIVLTFLVFNYLGFGSKIATTLVSFLGVILLAYILYTYIERKILKLKSRVE